MGSSSMQTQNRLALPGFSRDTSGSSRVGAELRSCQDTLAPTLEEQESSTALENAAQEGQEQAAAVIEMDERAAASPKAFQAPDSRGI